jgi:hypothetical protein
MKSKISKAHKAIVKETFERWQNTVFAGTPNIEKAKTCIQAAYTNGIGSYRRNHNKNKDIAFYTVASPVSFMIAGSVVRGRMNKKYAEELCKLLGLDAAFLKPLRRDSLAQWNHGRTRWWDEQREFARTWRRAIHNEYLEREKLLSQSTSHRRVNWRPGFDRNPENRETMYRTNTLDNVMLIITSMLNDSNALTSISQSVRGWDGVTRPISTTTTGKKLGEIQSAAIWGNNNTLYAIGELRRAIDIEDLLAEEPDDNGLVAQSVFLGSQPKAIDSEILCRILKLDAPEMTWEHEVFHHCTAFMAFQKSCVVLADRPTIHTDQEGEMHSTTGPAVSWADGTKLWFNNGHYMEEGGKYIVETPEKLSTEHILRIRNEETRRLAIEKFGWDKFIVEADCPVLDRRVNDVDNTIEMLVGPPQSETRDNTDAGRWRPAGQKRMVLFCRSTGRRYFLSVPHEVTSCESAQHWMANARIEGKVSYASKPMRLLGAS